MIRDDAEAADRQLAAFLARRALGVHEGRAGQQAANELELMWAESERRHRERLRRENSAEWVCHLSALAGAFRRRAEECERKAEALLRPSEGEGEVLS